MSEISTSKFTPMNVVIWCCVAVFVTVTIATIIAIGKPELLNDKDLVEKLRELMVYEIAAIGVAAFGKYIASQGQKKNAAQKVKNS